jgi:hypothetical protein
LIARNIILPRAKVLTARLLSRDAFVIALAVPIRSPRPIRLTLAH